MQLKTNTAFFAILPILVAASCKVVPQRVYYDFDNKRLQEKNTGAPKEIIRPLTYPASKDLQIEIFDHNPLKYELSTKDSFTNLFLSDTAALSAWVIMPTVPKLTEGEAKKATMGLGVAPVAPLGATSLQARIAAMAKQTDCDILQGFMYSFNLQKDKVENALTDYRAFLAKAEILQDIYGTLHKPEVLQPAAVTGALTNNFLANINPFLATVNAYLPAVSQLNAAPLDVSARQITALEEIFYNKVVSEEAALLQIQQGADGLKGTDCKNYVDLYKKFTAAVTTLKENVLEFKANRAGKILLAFSKTALLYDEMKQYLTAVPPYITPAITIQNDFHNILLYKKDLASGKTLIHDQISVEPTRGWKIDVAGGVFVSGMHDVSYTQKTMDSIYTKQYLVSGVRRDTTVQESYTAFYERDNSEVSYGGMLFFHAHSQNASWVNYGFYLGAGALFNNQSRWAGSLGGSILVGKKQRVNINLGALVSQVDRLSPPYQAGIWYRETFNSIPTGRDTKVSWMAGFSWNFR